MDYLGEPYTITRVLIIGKWESLSPRRQRSDRAEDRSLLADWVPSASPSPPEATLQAKSGAGGKAPSLWKEPAVPTVAGRPQGHRPFAITPCSGSGHAWPSPPALNGKPRRWGNLSKSTEALQVSAGCSHSGAPGLSKGPLPTPQKIW